MRHLPFLQPDVGTPPPTPLPETERGGVRGFSPLLSGEGPGEGFLPGRLRPPTARLPYNGTGWGRGNAHGGQTVSTDRISEYLNQFAQTRNQMLEQLRGGFEKYGIDEEQYWRVHPPRNR